MPLRKDIKKLLVIGSGPIVIGQAAEFDYAGTQACLQLKELGYEVVLCNSNPATIMTDREMADKIYMEPLDLEFISKIIRKERPDALITSLGGQTALNLAVQLEKKGILAECRVEVLGTEIANIEKGEDRKLFKKLCQEIGEPVLESYIANTVEEALTYANKIGYEIIVRPAFTLGGTGGGFAKNDDELRRLAEYGLKMSPANQVLIEKSIKGFKEIEFEVMRDDVDTCIAICSMENIDPVGVHTGDSMVVAPAQTLAKKEYLMLKNSALKIVQALKIKGGCNVQFALDPESFDYYIIEVNPRVSRSSALASKASGYPIAKVTALIACGLRLDEIQLGVTKACFEPAFDYVVTKFARFCFDKFQRADRTLSTQMKATGEVMSIDATFESSFMKGVRSLEIGVDHLELKKLFEVTTEDLFEQIVKPTDERIFEIAELIRRKVDIKEIYDKSKVDIFFLAKIKKIIDAEKLISKNIKVDDLRTLKKLGFADSYIARKASITLEEVSSLRVKNNIVPAYKYIDTCAGEFGTYIPYFYATYGLTSEVKPSTREKIIILGSGPIRIGQGVEFDYSTVHAVWALKELGYEAIVINNNPETVSTDYLMTDKLYFEGLTEEDVMSIVDFEKPKGIICTFGGQTAINLAERLTLRGVNLIGTNFKAIENAENRDMFDAILKKLAIKRPQGKTVFTLKEGLKAANDLGYPVIVRPSYILGGRAMQVVYQDLSLKQYLEEAFQVHDNQPVLIDKYILGKEIEIDAISDGTTCFIPGIMEHIEGTGIHSGDSISVYPPISISEKVKTEIIDIACRLGKGIGIVGLFNIQFIVDEKEDIYIIEVNPRSSRTVPFLSKVTKTNMANIATKAMLGISLKEQGITQTALAEGSMFYVKSPVFSFAKIKGLDSVLSPEMKSTGEAIGYDKSLNRALYKALKASNLKMANYGTVFVTLSDSTKDQALSLVKRFYDLGFNIEATFGTAKYLNKHEIKTRSRKKISEGSEEIIESIRKGYISYVLNTSDNSDRSGHDGFLIRQVASENNVTTFTSLDTVRVLLDILEEITVKVDTI
ncbi:MAG: carbamoyl-phosphate synthase large subunit [Erysipelotrichales bacterium]|nr:carbamoyl-phosphate synthase large subunit [Erysipelotrichales bacterium]